jgi:phthalate 4,5-dioxygenase reductase component
MLTPTICRIEFAPAAGARFPVAPPGSHVTVVTPAGHSRSYSVTDSTPGGDLAISVLREAEGRGGSLSLVDELFEGDEVELTLPVDSFPLVESEHYLLIAGGIGITAIRSFYRHLHSTGHPSVRLLYLVRSVEDAAYADELLDDPAVIVHESSLEGRVDLWPYLGTPDDSTQVYCCAGPALSDEVRRLTMHWRPSRIHFESFDGVEALGGLAAHFEAVWQPSGARIAVSAQTTLLRALRDEGITVPSSCESGTCGTCVLRLESGVADHRDLVLTEEERETRIISCVSRAAEGDLVVGPV